MELAPPTLRCHPHWRHVGRGGPIFTRVRRVRYASHAHASAADNSQLTFHLDHSKGADHPLAQECYPAATTTLLMQLGN